jgi:uncharacterized glyoxalase superfamily protein PhnB
MPRAVFDQVNLVSRNPAASIAFYRRLGLNVPEPQRWGSGDGLHHVNTAREEPVQVDFDIDSVAFARMWNAAWAGRDDIAGKTVLGFSVASRAEVDAIYAELTAAGAPGLQPPWDAFWGARFAIVEDPDGIAVGLMSPSSDEHRQPPPTP